MRLPFSRPSRVAAAPRKQNRRVAEVRPRAASAAPAPARKPAVVAGKSAGAARRNRRVEGAPRVGAKPAVLGPRGGVRAALAGALQPGGRGRRALGLFGRVAVALTLAWGVLYAVQAGYQFVTTSARFEAKSLVYQATPHVPVDRLQALLAIEPGTNILSVDPAALQAKVLAEPWVKRAEVKRSLPDTLIVEVEEHEAAAVLLSGQLYLVDREGTPFKRMEEGERGDLPVITGVDRAQLVADDPRAHQAVERGLAALSAYQQAPRPRLSEIHVDEGGAVSLYTAKTGAALRLGRGELEGKLARYDALRAALGERAERLAVVHLDLEAAPGAAERVVASFFDPEDEAAVLARGAGVAGEAGKAGAGKAEKAEKAEKAGKAEKAEKADKPGEGAKAKKKTKGKAKAHSFPSGIPRYD